MLTNFHTYQLAKKLYQDCTKMKVKNYVRDQLESASFSVCLNLAEGSGKSKKPVRLRSAGAPRYGTCATVKPRG